MRCGIQRQKRIGKIFVNSYDFILLDVGLPDTSGFQLLKEAKEGGKDAAFILITARGSIDDKITGLDLGADDYLAKPFRCSNCRPDAGDPAQKART